MPGKDRNPCEILEWDTDFFGFCIAQVRGHTLTTETLEYTDAWCRESGVKCLYFLARADDPATTRLAEDNGFRLVDIRVTLEREPVRLEDQEHRSVMVRHVRGQDLSALQAIAENSYHESRFYFDPSFPTPLCDRLYKTWIKVSFEGYADAVLVAERDATPIGYVSCHLDEGSSRGKVGLLGVSDEMRGHGVGKSLVFAAIDWFKEQGAQRVLVVTQGRNVVGQRLYQRCGFLTGDVQLWYHKWYQIPGSDQPVASGSRGLHE